MRLDNVFMGVISEALSSAKFVLFHVNGREISCDLIIDKGYYYALGVNYNPQVVQRYKLPASYYKHKPFFGAADEDYENKSVEYVRKYDKILTVNKRNVFKIEKNGVVKIEFKENKINSKEITDEEDAAEGSRRLLLWRGEVSEQQALASNKIAEVLIRKSGLADYIRPAPDLSIMDVINFLLSQGINAFE